MIFRKRSRNGEFLRRMPSAGFQARPLPTRVARRAGAQNMLTGSLSQLGDRWILNTHGHQDHTNGNDRAVELTGAPVAAHDFEKFVVGRSEVRLEVLVEEPHAFSREL